MSRASADNLTAQGALVKLVGLARAAELATELGGKLGTLEQRPLEKAAGENNPWSPTFKGGSEIAKNKILRTFGTKFAGELAKACGVSVLGYPLKK